MPYYPPGGGGAPSGSAGGDLGSTYPNPTVVAGAHIADSLVGKVTLTQPATAATLSIANNKTVAVSNSITLAGTDATTMTFPTTTASVARTDAAQTFMGAQTFATTILASVSVQDQVTGFYILRGSGTGTLQFASTSSINWSSTANNAGTVDLTMTRNAAGVAQIGTTTANASGSLLLTNLTASGVIKLGNAATTGLTPGVLAASTNASIVLTDSGGQAYRIPCII